MACPAYKGGRGKGVFHLWDAFPPTIPTLKLALSPPFCTPATQAIGYFFKFLLVIAYSLAVGLIF